MYSTQSSGEKIQLVIITQGDSCDGSTSPLATASVVCASESVYVCVRMRTGASVCYLPGDLLRFMWL